MTERAHHHEHLIFSSGTQVVALRDVIGQGGRILHPRGSMGVVLKAPNDPNHSYRVRLHDGVEETLSRDEVVMLTRYAVRQLRVERELASDDCVLLSGQSASDYAGQLLRTLRSCRSSKAAMGVAMAHSARLDQRVLAILAPQRRRNSVGSRLAIVLLGTVVDSLNLLTAGDDPRVTQGNEVQLGEPVGRGRFAQ